VTFYAEKNTQVPYAMRISVKYSLFINIVNKIRREKEEEKRTKNKTIEQIF
jgi:hypothetical protein